MAGRLEQYQQEEGVIPEIWIEDKNVRWPRGLNVTRAVKEKKKPSDTWYSFPLVKVKCRSDNRQICEEFNITTTEELSSDEKTTNTPSQGIQRLPEPPVKYTGTTQRQHSTSSEQNRIISGSTSPKQREHSRSPQRLTSSQHSRSHSSHTRSRHTHSTSPSSRSRSHRSRSRSHRSRSRSHHSQSRSHHSQSRSHRSQSWSRHSQSRSHRSRSNSTSLVDSIQVNSATGSSSSEAQRQKSPSSFPLTEEKFQKRVLHLLLEIRDNLQSVGKRYEPEASDFHVQKIDTIDKLHERENSLMDEAKKNLLVSRLGTVGGSSLKENVRNVMRRLFSNDVMSTMNMRGNGGKIAFKKTKCFQVVTASVLKSSAGTEADVAQAVCSMLKYAPDRKGGGGRNQDN